MPHIITCPQANKEPAPSPLVEGWEGGLFFFFVFLRVPLWLMDFTYGVMMVIEYL
jgi:hypothetical protein